MNPQKKHLKEKSAACKQIKTSRPSECHNLDNKNTQNCYQLNFNLHWSNTAIYTRENKQQIVSADRVNDKFKVYVLTFSRKYDPNFG